MSKALSLHTIRIQYKLLIQAFYLLKNSPRENESISKLTNKLETLFNIKQIKFVYGSFLKLKDNVKYSGGKGEEGKFDFSEYLSVKTKEEEGERWKGESLERSKIKERMGREEENSFSSECLTLRKLFPMVNSEMQIQYEVANEEEGQ